MATKPKRSVVKPKASPSDSSMRPRDTISDKLTQVLVTIGEVKVQQSNFQKQLEKWALEQHAESIRVNAKFTELQATDRANGDAVSKITAQLDQLTERVISANHTVRLTRAEADVIEIKQKTSHMDTIRISHINIKNTIRLQWIVLGLMLLLGAYLYGSYHSVVTLP